MKRIIIVHRWEGTSQDDWRPWLKTELEKAGCEVLVPDMPDTDAPVIGAWVAALSTVVGVPTADTYFIGHSIGCQTILRYLETIDTKIGGALFVAGWFNLENIEDEQSVQIAKPWIETPINIEKVKAVLPISTLLISKNDPYGAFQQNVDAFNQFVTRVSVVDNAGHFTAAEELLALEEFKKLV